MESEQNQAWILKSRPEGAMAPENFQLVDIPMPAALGQNEVLVKLVYLSVDPYLRGRLRDVKGYFVGPFEIDKPLNSGAIYKVVKSTDANIKEGALYTGAADWQIFQNQTAQTIGYPIQNIPGIPTINFASVLGMTALSAYLPLLKIGKPKAGETLFVSGAAGAVGLVAGQVGKLLGLRVLGSAGTDEKVEFLKGLGFDAVYNYKQVKTHDFLKENSPEGVDIYFDNVGGEILDQTLNHMKTYGRIIACGSISQYELTDDQQYGVKNLFNITTQRLTFQGFIVSDYATDFADAVKQLIEWVLQGKLKSKETVFQGFDKSVEAFMGLFTGVNIGKALIEV